MIVQHLFNFHLGHFFQKLFLSHRVTLTTRPPTYDIITFQNVKLLFAAMTWIIRLHSEHLDWLYLIMWPVSVYTCIFEQPEPRRFNRLYRHVKRKKKFFLIYSVIISIKRHQFIFIHIRSCNHFYEIKVMHHIKASQCYESMDLQSPSSEDIARNQHNLTFLQFGRLIVWKRIWSGIHSFKVKKNIFTTWVNSIMPLSCMLHYDLNEKKYSNAALRSKYCCFKTGYFHPKSNRVMLTV